MFMPVVAVLLPLTSALFVQALTDAVHPIVLIPGHSCSRLLFSVDPSVPGSPQSCPPDTTNATLWIPVLTNNEPPEPDCWLQSASIRYDVASRKSLNAPGVTVTTTPFGDLDGVEHLIPEPRDVNDVGYYQNLVNGLVPLGYVRNKNLEAAPFDFRFAPNENKDWFIKMRNLIEEMYETNGQKSVILIAHSMGSQFSYVFLQQQPIWWKEKYIRSYVLIASCLGGVFLAQSVYFSEHLDVNSFPVSRLAERTYPSIAFLLPRVAAFGDEVLIKSSNAEYRAEDYGRFFQELRNPNAFEQWKDVQSIYDAGNITSQGPFSTYCVAGFGVKTLRGAEFRGPLDQDSSFESIFGDGDGTANDKSMRLCYRMGEGKQNFGFKEFMAFDHDQIIQKAEPIHHVVSVVNSINNNVEIFKHEFP